MTSIELTDKEKEMFLCWISQKEKVLQEEIELLKGIRDKLENKEKLVSSADPKSISENAVAKKVLSAHEDNSASWVNAIRKELQHFSHPVQSGDIVKRLLQKPSLFEKGKRFVTKAVTSKLWLLQERGEVVKTRENGRFVYSLKN